MVFCLEGLAEVNLFLVKKRTGQVTNTSLHQGWVRVL